MRGADTRTIKNPAVNQNSIHFCTIAYQAESGRHLKPISKGTLLVVVKTALEGVRFFVNPFWREVVDSDDAMYLQDVFDDLPRRAKNQTDDIFAQLCELSVGPLATVDVGEVPVDDAFFVELTAKFTQI